jgi:hypothetical protein
MDHSAGRRTRGVCRATPSAGRNRGFRMGRPFRKRRISASQHAPAFKAFARPHLTNTSAGLRDIPASQSRGSSLRRS